jgi:hypothetical protein
MTAAIEQREEDYLRRVAARNAAHAAAVEAERRAAEGERPSMATHVAWVLRRLCVASTLFLLLAVAVVYVLYLKADGRHRLPQSLVQAASLCAALVLGANTGGWVAARRCSVTGVRALFVAGVALVLGLAVLLDEVNLVRTSHEKLQERLAQGEDALTQDALQSILNGGTVPSLVQRFVFDAPSGFLRWLSAECSSASTRERGYASVAIDRRQFFSPLWDASEKACASATLRSCIRLEEVAQPILIAELVAASLQVLVAGAFLAVRGSPATGKTPKKRRQLSPPKRTPSRLESRPSASMVTSRVLTLGTALFGSSSALASTDLLHLCSIADFHELFTWILAVCLVSGLAAVLAALLLACRWRQQLAGVLLVLAVTSEVFVLAEFVDIAARFVGPEVQLEALRHVYLEASAQTCSSIKRWISHVCVDMSAGTSPADFDSSCQHEFVALLLASLSFTNSYLAWSVGVKLALLVQLILPALRQAALTVAAYACCLSPREDLTATSAGSINTLQQSAPPLEYHQAVENYLTSLRGTDPARIAAEREAFEKEWSARTGRVLSSVRTPRVFVSASDYGAIVRTLILRRLTSVCKLDVSLSVSADGQLLLVRIGASDNLLLATLCETETYRLQFADAVDPGRRFWHDKREVNSDQKILDAHTVKHKLKLLSVGNAMPPREAVWFPGESLARVSARVHALARIARAAKGLIRCENPAPAFASYSPSVQRQFVYKKYPNRLDIPDAYRRSAVLRTVDCIRIARRIIRGEFDTDAAVSRGLLSYFHCLHSASRFDLNSRAALACSWITFWRPVHLPGEFSPEEHAIRNVLGRIAPFRQPLQSVRDYFGELVAFYFAWLALYAKMLALPALVAVAVVTNGAQRSQTAALWGFYTSPLQRQADDASKIEATISSPELLLGLAVLVWSFALAKLWERQSVWYQLQWGVHRSDAVADVGSHGASALVELHKPSLRTEIAALHRQLASWLCVLALGGANLAAVLALLLAQGVCAELWGEKLAVLGSSGCQALLVQWNGACIPSVAQALGRWESALSSEPVAYQSAVVAKLFALQLLNTFSGLILLVLSSVGGLEPLAQLVAPLRPLYVAYSARIDGHVGVFVQMGTLLLSLFAVQLSVRLVLILSAASRFRAVQRGDSYGSRKFQDETQLSPYPGPHKDYAQLVMQLGLVVAFSAVCPLLPMLALIDCAVKLRQGALELCCIRQRPEPHGVQGQPGDDEDVGLGLWAPYLFLMLKWSAAAALVTVFFAADNCDAISVERRVGWLLVAVAGSWLAAQLLWFVIPRESRRVEEARARNTLLVERYFGQADAHEQKPTPKEGKHVEMEALNLHDPVSSIEQSLHHYEERLVLLQRLNVALRKRREIGGSASAADAIPAIAKELVAPAEAVGVHEAADEGEKLLARTEDDEAPQASSAEHEALQRGSESSEEMIVGYFRPVRETWSPQLQPEEVDEVKVDLPTESVESPPRRGSVFPGTLPVSELKSSEGGGDSVVASQPVPMRLSKLFKRVPPPPSTAAPDSTSAGDAVDAPLPTSPFADSPRAELEPGVFAPAELTAEPTSSREGSRSLEDKAEAQPSADGGVALSAATPGIDADVDSPLRRLSPRLSFLSRRPKSPAATHSDNGGSDRDSHAESERTLLRQLSPRLSFLSRKAKRSSSKASDSEESKSSANVPEQPAPRRLSKLFRRAQPPASATTSPPEPPAPATTSVSAFERTEMEDRASNPVTSLRDQFDFLSDTRSCSTADVHSVAAP